MGRNISTTFAVSDIAYALCNFGGPGGCYYQLLGADFKPAKRIPRLAPVAAPISVSGSVAPSGFGAALNPVFAIGAWSGPANTTGSTFYQDGLLQQAISFGGANSSPGNSNNNFGHYTGRCGEYGHDFWHLDATGALLLPQRNASYGIETKTEASDAFVSADFADHSLTLMLWKSCLYLCRRSQVEDVIVSEGSRGFLSKFTVPDLPPGFYGTASYNRSRSELVIIGGSSPTSSSGMWLRLYQNLPEITATADLAAVLSAITPIQKSITWSGWSPSANAEAVGGATPVLTDNGDVYIGFFNASAALYIVRFPRTDDTTFGTPVNAISYGVTTTYGRDSSRGSGMQVMQTRDGDTVAFYSQYNYYGAGMGVLTVNKRTNSIRVMYSDSDTTYGRSLLHWGETGFAVAFNSSGAHSAHNLGIVYGYNCSGQTASTSPTQHILPIPNGFNTGGIHPFYVEVSA